MHPEAGTRSSRTSLFSLWILAALLATATAWIPSGFPPIVGREWAVAGLGGAALAAALLTLGGNLPAQNLAALAVIVGGIAWGFHSLPEALLVRPAPPRLDMVSRASLDAAGILVARGTARRILGPIRGSPRYGLWLVGTASILAAAWSVRAGQLAFPGVPPTPVRHAACAAVALVAATPWILSKRPVPEVVDLRPTVLWSLTLGGVAAIGFASGLAASSAVLPELLAAFPWIVVALRAPWDSDGGDS
jgi:hypothetical protein